MGKQVTLNLFGVINKQEAAKGRKVTVREIAEATGLNETGLYRAKNNQSSGVDFDTLGKLLDYFNREGLPELTLGELFSVEEEGGVDEGKAAPAQVALGEQGKAA